ncbi:MAG: NTP transferase domain-containing protein [Taibaiella sp.]|nr:NTP transferase domain-containing protein [Taibaiella sp.]
MKAIIPVAGAGTKLRPHTYTQPKALIPMAGKTILSVIVDELIKWEIDEYIFIIGYLGDKIQDYVMEKYPDLKCTFITQNERKGTGHAIYLTRSAVQEEEVAIVFGDTICSFDIQEVLNSPYSMIGVKRVEDPRLFGVAEIDEQHFVRKVAEKPLIPKSNLALVGVYKIKETKDLFDALEECLQSGNAQNGEYHLTLALQLMIDKGIKLKAFEVKSWFDCGKKETLLETNATLLRRLQRNNQDTTASYPNTVIIPPVHIGEGCKIENSIVGPNVAVGDYAQIRSSIIHNTIIGAYAELHEIVLKQSIIGSDAYVHGLSQSLNIGDNTDVDLG